MANTKSIYVVGYNDTLHLIEAEGVNEVKAHVLSEVKYTVEKATSREVADMMSKGTKVVTVAAKA